MNYKKHDSLMEDFINALVKTWPIMAAIWLLSCLIWTLIKNNLIF